MAAVVLVVVVRVPLEAVLGRVLVVVAAALVPARWTAHGAAEAGAWVATPRPMASSAPSNPANPARFFESILIAFPP